MVEEKVSSSEEAGCTCVRNGGILADYRDSAPTTTPQRLIELPLFPLGHAAASHSYHSLGRIRRSLRLSRIASHPVPLEGYLYVRLKHIAMPQGDYIERHKKLHGQRLDHEERMRKRGAREVRRRSEKAQTLTGIQAKLYNKQRFKEKAAMKKALHMHFEKDKAHADKDQAPDGAVPAYLLDREAETRSKVLSNTLKQKRKEKAGKWNVPLPKVRPIAEDEVFGVVKSGKRNKKSWKRKITKATFVGENFTRKPVKYERFQRPMGLRIKKVNCTHPELKTTFCLDILGVKKNPSSQLFTSLGVITRGTILEVNVADLGLVTSNGKVVFGKYAQVTNNPENDGCCNATLLV
jgi:ribosome biogenesis protein NSA2